MEWLSPVIRAWISIAQNISTSMAAIKSDLNLPEVPDGRAIVAHLFNGGAGSEMIESPVGAAHLLGLVPPLRGLTYKAYTYPPLTRWATIFRP